MTPRPLDASRSDFLVVEDEQLLCDLVRLTLQNWFEPRAMTSCGTAREALRAIADAPPQLLIADLQLPDADGREVIRELRRKQLETRVIVLTGRIDVTLAPELIALGVAGLVEKSRASAELKMAVERVLDGGLFYSASVAPAPSRVVSRPAVGAPADVLQPRERELARLVASGLSSKEVAARMGLGPRTVEKYRAEIMDKTGTRDFAGLVRWCVQNGIV